MPSPTPAKTQAAVLTPYHTATLTATVSPSLLEPTRTPLPPPTATQFTHTVKKEETLLGIAFQYGIKLEDLLAANPGVNVRFLSIGTVLVVPLSGQLATTAPTVAPPPLQVSQPTCYAASDSVLQCLATVMDPLEDAYENLTLQFDLYEPDGDLVTGQFVIPPLDRILPGGTLPLLASFPGILESSLLPEGYSARLTLLSAVPVTVVEETSDATGSYMEADIHDLSIHISEDVRSALVAGKARVQSGTNLLWIVAVAYDINQHPVGLRRLELIDVCPKDANTTLQATALPGGPVTCGELPFQLYVYSLGPAIERVELLSEARR